MTARTLFELGFRPFYLLATVFAIVAVLLWLLTFSGMLSFGIYLQSVFWHSHEMVFGFLVAVIAGFQFTAVRNWTGMPTPAGAPLAMITLLWLAARVLLVTGPTVPAIVADVLFLPVVTIAVAMPILRSRNRRNYKVIGLLGALAVLHVAFHLALTGGLPAWLSRTSLFAAIDVIVILFALIGGRIVPAFTRNAIPGSNPRYERHVEVLAFGSLLLLALLTLVAGSTGVPAWLAAALAGAAALAHAWRLALWQPWLTTANPLLWMLPVSYAWLPVALLLRALAGYAFVVPGTWIHALTAGALSSLIMAMMMRSSLGHTGRPLRASGPDMAAFLALQVAAVLRVVAGVSDGYRTMVIVSGAVWIAAFLVLLLRYLPVWTQPRVDGKPCL